MHSGGVTIAENIYGRGMQFNQRMELGYAMQQGYEAAVCNALGP